MNKITHTLAGAAIAGMFALGGGAALAQSNPTDAQIAGIVVTANQVDIDAGKLAHNKAANAEVKAFAQQMVTDHTGVNQQAGALVKKLKVTPQADPAEGMGRSYAGKS